MRALGRAPMPPCVPWVLQDDDLGLEVFNRVERTFCCGLQSNEPETRQKVGVCVCARVDGCFVRGVERTFFWGVAGGRARS